MNRITKIILIVLMTIPSFSYSQTIPITKESFLKQDSIIWAELDSQIDSIAEILNKFPEKADSIENIVNTLSDIAEKRYANLLVKHASVLSNILEKLYFVRGIVGKDTLSSILNSLPTEKQNSPYGKTLLKHIETEQITVGSKYYDFSARDRNNEEFSLSSLRGKNILLIYGGLGCMGEERRNFLNDLHKKTNRNDFEIVVYQYPCSNLEDLNNFCDKFKNNFINVSDFLLDHSPFKINYGTQITPTLFFINKKGIVIYTSISVEFEKLNDLLKDYIES